MQEAFDLGLIDGTPEYGDWLRTPFRLEDCEVDGILLAFAPPEILPRVLGQFLFQAATMCDTGEADEYVVDELCHHYSLFSREDQLHDSVLDQSAFLTREQCLLIRDVLKESASHAQSEYIREHAAKSIVDFWEVRCDEEAMSKRPPVPPFVFRRPLPEHWGHISLGPEDDLYLKENTGWAELHKMIRTAFPPRMSAPWGAEGPDEASECASVFRGYWLAISPAVVEQHCTCITAFSDEDFATYFPAYMVAALGKPNGDAAASMMDELVARRKDLPRLFTEDQLSLVRKVLSKWTRTYGHDASGILASKALEVLGRASDP